MNTFIGEAKTKYANIFTQSERMAEAYAKAVEEQFAKAYVGITSSKWWEGFKKKAQ